MKEAAEVAAAVMTICGLAFTPVAVYLALKAKDEGRR